MSGSVNKSLEKSKIHNVRLDSHFTVTANRTPEDPNLSWAAKGLLWYILSRPPNWNIYITQLASIYAGEARGGGIKAIWKLIKELRDAGYVKYTKSQQENGYWNHRYDVYPMPTEAFQKQFPHSSERSSVKGCIIRNHDLNKNSSKKESIPPTPKRIAPPDKKKNSTIPPSASAARASTPSHVRNSSEKVNSTEILSSQLSELLDLYEKHPSYFRERIFSGWIKKFGAPFVLDTLKFFLHIKGTQKKPIPNPEAWMEAAFIKNYAKVHKQAQVNKEFAQNLKKRYSLKRLKINQRYCQDTETNKDFYYDLPQDDFQRYLYTMFEQEDPYED